MFRARESPTRRALALAVAIGISGTLPVFLVGALAVQIRDDLHFSASALGLTVSLFFGVAAVSAMPFGALADRIGWWRSIRVAVVGISAAMLVAGLLARQWVVLLVALVIAAISHSLGMPAGSLAIVRMVPTGRRGLAFGLRQGAVPISTILGGLSVPLIAVRIGWRPVFLLALGAPIVVVALLAGLRDAGARDVARVRAKASRQTVSAPLVLMFCLGALGAGIVNSASAFLVITAVDSGISESGAGFLLVGGSLLGLTARVGSGLFVDHRRSRGFAPIIVLLAGGSVGFALLSTGRPWGILAGTALGVGMGTGWPGLLHYVVTTQHPQNAGGVSGIVLAAGYTGGSVGPAVFGLIADRASYAAGWLMLSGLALVAIALVAASGRGFARAQTAEKRTSKSSAAHELEVAGVV